MTMVMGGGGKAVEEGNRTRMSKTEVKKVMMVV